MRWAKVDGFYIHEGNKTGRHYTVLFELLEVGTKVVCRGNGGKCVVVVFGRIDPVVDPVGAGDGQDRQCVVVAGWMPPSQ